MNILASHLPLKTTITPSKVGGASLAKSYLSPSIEISKLPPSDTTSHDIKTTVNPSDEKTVIPDVNAEKPKTSASQSINSVKNSTPETQPEIKENSGVPKKKAEQQQNHEIYSEAELEQISALKLLDTEVSAHEKAHSAVGGLHAGSPSYIYKTGPDGVKYAISGRVSIDTSRVPGDPQATLQKAKQIKTAALAPMDPSVHDKKIAAQADHMASEARSKLLETNSASEYEKTAPASVHESSARKHFTAVNHLSINNELDSTIQQQMSERSFHINQFYQNSAKIREPASLDIQV